MDNEMNLISWNCNGCKNHYPELRDIVNIKSPFCICIQETHLKQQGIFDINYRTCREDTVPHLRARGILTKEDIPNRQILLQSRLQIIAVRVDFPIKLSIFNIYLPDGDWDTGDIQEVIDQLPTPVLIMGNFNAHNPLWGSKRLDRRGRLIENLLNDNDLILLNTGEGTYLNQKSNNLSALDLALCSPSVAPPFQWKCLGDHLTDHFPASIEFVGRTGTHGIPKRWKLDNANWALFKENLENFVLLSTGVNEATRIVTDKIISAALTAVTQTKGVKGKKMVPWWNEETAF